MSPAAPQAPSCRHHKLVSKRCGERKRCMQLPLQLASAAKGGGNTSPLSSPWLAKQKVPPKFLSATPLTGRARPAAPNQGSMLPSGQVPQPLPLVKRLNWCCTGTYFQFLPPGHGHGHGTGSTSGAVGQLRKRRVVEAQAHGRHAFQRLLHWCSLQP